MTRKDLLGQAKIYQTSVDLFTCHTFWFKTWPLCSSNNTLRKSYLLRFCYSSKNCSFNLLFKTSEALVISQKKCTCFPCGPYISQVWDSCTKNQSARGALPTPKLTSTPPPPLFSVTPSPQTIFLTFYAQFCAILCVFSVNFGSWQSHNTNTPIHSPRNTKTRFLKL